MLTRMPEQQATRQWLRSAWKVTVGRKDEGENPGVMEELEREVAMENPKGSKGEGRGWWVGVGKDSRCHAAAAGQRQLTCRVGQLPPNDPQSYGYCVRLL